MHQGKIKSNYYITLMTGIILVIILDYFTFYNELLPGFIDSLNVYGIRWDSYYFQLVIFIVINIFCVVLIGFLEKSILTIKSGIVLLFILSFVDLFSTVIFVNLSDANDYINWDKLIIQLKIILNLVLTPILIFILVIIPQVLKSDKTN